MSLNPDLDVKSVLQSEGSLREVIMSEDRHDLSNFLWKVRDLTANGGILPEEDPFRLFRSGYALDCVLGIRTVRTPYSAEILDKINYLTLVPDIESLNRTFTDSRLISGVVSNDKDAAFWFRSGGMFNLPVETKVKMASALIRADAPEKALTALDTVARDLETQRKYDGEAMSGMTDARKGLK